MQLSRLEWVSSIIGLIAIVVSSAGYIISLQKDVSNLEEKFLNQKNEMTAFKKKLILTIAILRNILQPL